MKQDISLPAPRRNATLTLMDAVSQRRSCRDFLEKEIDLQVLSDVLWIAWGRNRRKGRTAPSSHNSQEIDLYVSLASGTYIYDTDENKLVCVLDEDIRGLAGVQDFVAKAPVNITFVADLTKLIGKNEREAEDTAYVDTGFISQNIYLACVAYGLSGVVRIYIDKPALAAKLNLPENKIITLSHTIGYAAPRTEK